MTIVDYGAAALMLLGARQSRQWLPSLPEGCRPRTMEDAYAIQELVIRQLGPIAGWKVGAGNPEAQPACAAMSASTIFDDGACLSMDAFNLVGIEGEIGYRLAQDLPVRDEPYSRDEVEAAIGSIHPIVEVSDTRYATWGSQERLGHVADQLNHGALVVGAGVEDWQKINPADQKVKLTINGKVVSDIIAKNPAGDPMRLVLWLANEGARIFGGLRAGAVITTGTLTGISFQTAPAEIHAGMPGLGNISFKIG
jgi:2-keto-4-pentenoate hydratase